MEANKEVKQEKSSGQHKLSLQHSQQASKTHKLQLATTRKEAA